MNFKYLLIVLSMTPFLSHAQVGINTTSPLVGTALHIEGGDAGLLINRVALTGKNDTATIAGIGASQTGLLVFNTATTSLPNKANNVFPGFYYWTGTAWQPAENGGPKRTGWVSLSDADTSISLTGISNIQSADPLNYTHILLDFDNSSFDSTLSSYAPSGYNAFDFYSDATHTIRGLELGDAIQLRIQCNALPEQNNSYLILAIDIGTATTPIIIYQKTIPLLRGSGVNNRISESILLYQLGTFIANGAKIRIGYNQGSTGAGGSVTLSDFNLVIQRL